MNNNNNNNLNNNNNNGNGLQRNEQSSTQGQLLSQLTKKSIPQQ